jgi:hypothetical protein
MDQREFAIIIVVAIAVPALLLIRLVPIARASETGGRGVSRALGRSQISFYGGVAFAAVIVLLLKFC